MRHILMRTMNCLELVATILSGYADDAASSLQHGGPTYFLLHLYDRLLRIAEEEDSWHTHATTNKPTND